MAHYIMEDGIKVDTTDAQQCWMKGTRLYKSAEGRYYIVHGTHCDSAPRAYWISKQEAASWLKANADLDDIIPGDLLEFIIKASLNNDEPPF